MFRLGVSKRCNQLSAGVFSLMLILTCFSLTSIVVAANSTDAGCQTFYNVGHTVCAKFLEYWQANGGLVQQGYPVSDVFEEQNAPPPAGDGQKHIVQYFERARFEYHPENKPPFDVLLGLLGAEQFKSRYPTGKIGISPTSGNCQLLTQSVFKVCDNFLQYWQGKGGIAQFGLPISNPFDEQNAMPPAGDGKIHRVQYFERARFEQHLENSPPYNLLLGLLGSEQFQAKYNRLTPSTHLTVPGIPIDLTASPDYSKITLSWKAPNNDGGMPILGYLINRRKASTGDEVTVYSNSAATVYTDNNVITGTDYNYFVQTVNLIGSGGFSPPIFVTAFTSLPVPGAPLLTSAVGKDQAVILIWDVMGEVNNIKGFNVYRLDKNIWTKIASTSSQIMKYLDTGLYNGNSYTYRVTAFNSYGESLPSTPATAVPVRIIKVPAPPGNLVPIAGNHQVRLNWSQPIDQGGGPIVGYNVYRWDAGIPAKINGSSLVKTTTYLDTGLTNGKIYKYTVRAVNTGGEGAPSDEVTVRFPA